MVKVKDIREIARYGVMVTPAVVIDGELKSVGKIPDLDEVLGGSNNSESGRVRIART